MIIDCISDLHGHYPQLEGGDLLIVGGDLTATDDIDEYLHFMEWLDDQEYKKIIIISGNHDVLLTDEKLNPKNLFHPYDYLCDSGTEFEGLKIWGSSWTSYFKGMNPNCMAFTINAGCDTDQWLAEKWALIPDDVEILITHSPPYEIYDYTNRGENAGSVSLKNEVLCRVKPKYHFFGHIHECGGNSVDIETTTFANASHVNERYEPVNKPIRVEL